MVAQHINHGKPFPINNNRGRPSIHHHAITSSTRLLSGPHIDSIACPSSKGSYSPPHLAATGSCLLVIFSI
ncbi:hypothetical protein BJY00DRAFT_286514 [Aspergillus carlsbadensis]|nr:hypothetical protein BJY00DRAFT_286514 [Aspergillus carlsbadensis]